MSIGESGEQNFDTYIPPPAGVAEAFARIEESGSAYVEAHFNTIPDVYDPRIESPTSARTLGGYAVDIACGKLTQSIADVMILERIGIEPELREFMTAQGSVWRVMPNVIHDIRLETFLKTLTIEDVVEYPVLGTLVARVIRAVREVVTEGCAYRGQSHSIKLDDETQGRYEEQEREGENALLFFATIIAPVYQKLGLDRNAEDSQRDYARLQSWASLLDFTDRDGNTLFAEYVAVDSVDAIIDVSHQDYGSGPATWHKVGRQSRWGEMIQLMDVLLSDNTVLQRYGLGVALRRGLRNSVEEAIREIQDHLDRDNPVPSYALDLTDLMNVRLRLVDRDDSGVDSFDTVRFERYVKTR